MIDEWEISVGGPLIDIFWVFEIFQTEKLDNFENLNCCKYIKKQAFPSDGKKYFYQSVVDVDEFQTIFSQGCQRNRINDLKKNWSHLNIFFGNLEVSSELQSSSTFFQGSLLSLKKIRPKRLKGSRVTFHQNE